MGISRENRGRVEQTNPEAVIFSTVKVSRKYNDRNVMKHTALHTLVLYLWYCMYTCVYTQHNVHTHAHLRKCIINDGIN